MAGKLKDKFDPIEFGFEREFNKWVRIKRNRESPCESDKVIIEQYSPMHYKIAEYYRNKTSIIYDGEIPTNTYAKELFKNLGIL